jgi:hypothetical protein
VHLAQRATWAITANNLQVDLESVRRCYLVRLDAGVENPDERPAAAFRHPELLDYIRTHRGELLAACYTLGWAWIRAGRPAAAAGTRLLGSFTAWGRTIGGILALAGVEGFLANHGTIAAGMSEQREQYARFLAGWWKYYGDDLVTARTIFDDMEDDRRHPFNRGYLPDELRAPRDATASEEERLGWRTRFGKALSRHKDAIHGGYRLTLHDRIQHAARWKLVRMVRKTGGSEAGEATGAGSANPRLKRVK